MKKVKTILATLMALCMIFMLAACGEADTEASKPTSSVTEKVESQPEAGSIAGTYTFEYTDVYGDDSNITVTIKDDAGFTLTTEGAMGDETYTGRKWTDNGDGTFQTGATDTQFKADFANAVGAVTWAIDGTTVAPVGYTIPTEFLSKAAPDPAIGGEAVGIYTYAFANQYGSTVPYVVWVNADNTYTIYMDNSFKGLATYSGDSWTIGSDGVITFGPFTLDEGIPDGAWFVEGTDGFTSFWNLHSDGTCEPVGYESTDLDVTTLSEKIYPANAQYVGIYTFATVNNFGSTVPYILWLNADGTAVIYCNNSFKGILTYTVESWTVNDDGTISLGKTTAENGVPDGEWFSTDDDHTSTWVVNDDGTCVPANFTGTASAVIGSEQPAEIYPQYITGA